MAQVRAHRRWAVAANAASLAGATDVERAAAADERARFIATDTSVDYTATVDDLGISGRPLAESMRDTVRWLVDAGHLSPRAAGKCRTA